VRTLIESRFIRKGEFTRTLALPADLSDQFSFLIHDPDDMLHPVDDGDSLIGQ